MSYKILNIIKRWITQMFSLWITQDFSRLKHLYHRNTIIIYLKPNQKQGILSKSWTKLAKHQDNIDDFLFKTSSVDNKVNIFGKSLVYPVRINTHYPQIKHVYNKDKIQVLLLSWFFLSASRRHLVILANEIDFWKIIRPPV
jgi:hypothetical protein